MISGSLPPLKFLRRLVSSKHVIYGIPFVGLIVGTTLIFRDFQQSARYDYRKVQSLTKAEAEEKYGVKFDEVKPVEVELQESTKKVKNEYSMIRGPRPWEEETVQTNAEIKQQAQKEVGTEGKVTIA